MCASASVKVWIKENWYRLFSYRGRDSDKKYALHIDTILPK